MLSTLSLISVATCYAMRLGLTLGVTARTGVYPFKEQLLEPASVLALLGGDRRLCPNSPSPCHLSTTGFDQDPRLQARLDSDQVFFLEPIVQRIQNANYPEAKPVQSEHDNYLIGEWKRDIPNGARDTFALVANGDATVNLNMHDLTGDMGLANEKPPLNTPEKLAGS